MPQEGTRHRRTPHLYNILVVPVEEGGKTRSFRTSRLAMAGLILLAFFASVAVTLAILVYTPLALYVPIPNPGLEERYGRQILETQRRLNALAEEFMVVRDYNSQLRKALGEGAPHDTSAARVLGKGKAAEAQEPLRGETALQHAPEADAGSALDLGVEDEASPAAYTTVVTASGPARTAFPLQTPVEGFVTQGFDPSRNHFGIDIAGSRGTPVYAAGDGVVLFAGWTYDDGNLLIVAHGAGYVTVYKHNQALLKSTLNPIKRGELVALLGTSGTTSVGPHLHFEVWKNGVPQDPNDYLLVPARRQ